MAENPDALNEFDPMNYDCDVPDCGARKGEFCDPDLRGFHAMRGADAIIEISKARKKRMAEEKIVSRFRKPMDLKSVRDRLVHDTSNPIYRLAVEAAGEQNAYTVDVLAQRLKDILPTIIVALAMDIEEENERRGI